MSVGRKGKDRIDRDHYVTPQWCVDLLVSRVAVRFGRPVFWHEVIDIGAGDGRIGLSIQRRVVDAGGERPDAFLYEISCKARRDLRNEVNWIGGDFLGKANRDLLLEAMKPDRRILFAGNPPYSCADEMADFVLNEAMPRAAEGSELWFLLRLDWLGSQKRAKWMETNSPTLQGTVSPRPNFKEHVGERSADSGEYAWFGWTNHPGRGFPGVVKPIQVWPAYDQFRGRGT